MSTNESDRRGRNGKRLDGRMLATQVAHEVNQMMLAQAFITAKSAGLELLVMKHDGVPRIVPCDEGKRDDRLLVNVTNGIVRKSWVG